jgi:ubiquinone/menaquinone biosynthesis C-methylase UbiE
MLCSVSVFDRILKQIEVAREYCSDLDNVEFTQDSETDLSFHDGTFDSVTSTTVLDCIVDIDSVVAELRRVLRKSGRFCTNLYYFVPMGSPSISRSRSRC